MALPTREQLKYFNNLSLDEQEIIIEWFELFNKVNATCESTGEQVVPFNKDNLEYYQHQMENLDATDYEMIVFGDWLETQVNDYVVN